ncbi:hypothetical protein Ahy_A10g050204 [Arachis hypogaea]|uniref:Uncharacterized protein n=1 Tax=Arachis hypogaea TaxID=3818 RepID=A0A445B8R5_ARAHY|nr:hypothetical protein Ahy_A10g050204 [Arachis hypogaea]
MYEMLDREKNDWMVLRLELRYSHPCSAKKSIYYHEYRELTMQAKCVIENNDEVDIRPNKTYLALSNKFVHKYDVFRNKEQNKLEDNATDSKGVIPCASSSAIKKQFQQDNVRGPSRVATKGRPKTKRVGADMDKSIKKSMRKRKRSSSLEVDESWVDNGVDTTVNEDFNALVR